MTLRLISLCLCAGLLVPCGPLAAEDAPSATAEPEAPSDEPTVGVIQGTNVNVRVGPRIDGGPILKLQEGDVVLITERVPQWFGVQVPQGLPAAVASRYVRAVGEDAVRVAATKLNLRIAPPLGDGPMPPAFRDHPEDQEVLPLIRSEGDWSWVIAPERVRAYVFAKYVKELGPLSEHGAVVEAARAKRTTWMTSLAENRMSRRVARASSELRDAMGNVQEQLHRLRLQGGWDRAPVVALANGLDAARQKHTLAPVRLRQLAGALRADLASELSLRKARRDAEVARARGLDPDPAKLPAPKVSSVTFTGVLRWESVPSWRNGGAWILWVKDQPTHVVRLTTGMPLPHPKLQDHADGLPRTVRGAQPGEREFGLPVIDLRSIARPN